MTKKITHHKFGLNCEIENQQNFYERDKKINRNKKNKNITLTNWNLKTK